MRIKFTFLQNKQQFLFLAASSIAMGASWMFLYEVYQQIGLVIASLTCYCGPAIIITFSELLFEEKLTCIKALGLVAVMCGIVFVSVQGLQDGGSLRGFIGDGISAVIFAIMVILNNKADDIKGLECRLSVAEQLPDSSGVRRRQARIRDANSK